MKKYFTLRLVQSFGFALMLVLMVGCSDAEEPMPEAVKDSLYFKFTLDGNQYSSEIKESNLIPGSGNEKLDNPSTGMNFMMYDYFSNIIWMNYSNECGTASGRDCLAFRFQVPANLKVDSYPTLFTFGIDINGQNFVSRYNGPELNPKPADLSVNVVITKYDEVNNIVEGTVKGLFYKFQGPTAKSFPIDGEFRLYIFKN